MAQAFTGLFGMSALSGILGWIKMQLQYFNGKGHIADIPVGIMMNNAKTIIYTTGSSTAGYVCAHNRVGFGFIAGVVGPTGGVFTWLGMPTMVCDASDNLWAVGISSQVIYIKKLNGATLALLGSYSNNSKTWSNVLTVHYDPAQPTKIFIVAKDATSVFVITVTVADGTLALSSAVVGSTGIFNMAVNIGNNAYLPVMLSSKLQMYKFSLSAGTLTSTIDSTLAATSVSNHVARLCGSHIGATCTSASAWFNTGNDTWDTANARGSLLASNCKVSIGDGDDAIWFAQTISPIEQMYRWDKSTPNIRGVSNFLFPGTAALLTHGDTVIAVSSITGAALTIGSTAAENNNSGGFLELTP